MSVGTSMERREKLWISMKRWRGRSRSSSGSAECGARAGQDMIRRLEGKSDAELMQELARLQSQLAANNIGPAQQKALVKSLMPMMKGPQRQRLQRVLNMLGE